MHGVGRGRGRRRRCSGIHRWHRRAGVAVAAVLVLLLITGVPLQLSAALGLGSRYVSATWILDWYGLQAPVDVRVDGPLISVGDTLFLTARPVATLEDFRGAVSLGTVIVAAGGREVVLLDAATGSELDRFLFDAAIRRIGRNREAAILDTSAGLRLADRDLVNWGPPPPDASATQWREPTPADAATAERHRRLFRQRMLTLERLLQDLHSGRVFGTPGVLVIDLASVLLAFLAASGLVMWGRAQRR